MFSQLTLGGSDEAWFTPLAETEVEAASLAGLSIATLLKATLAETVEAVKAAAPPNTSHRYTVDIDVVIDVVIDVGIGVVIVIDVDIYTYDCISIWISSTFSHDNLQCRACRHIVAVLFGSICICNVFHMQCICNAYAMHMECIVYEHKHVHNV
jgi:hypothetical protein